MNVRKKIIGIMLVALMVLYMGTRTAHAEALSVCSEPRWSNIAGATLTIGFDANNVGYFAITLSPYSSCTGLSGMMRLLDENGNSITSWAIYDDVSPYVVERSYQCEEGKTYTVTFQGYAYGNGSTQFDDINLSTSDTCD